MKRSFSVPSIEDVEKKRKDAEERNNAVLQFQNKRESVDKSETSKPTSFQEAFGKQTKGYSLALPRAAKPILQNTIGVNPNQKGNPVLNFIRQVPYSFSESVADYQVGEDACVLFLSLKYHRLHPEYIYTRTKELRDSYKLRILLVLADIEDPQSDLRELTKLGFTAGITLVLAWSYEECGKYIETFKIYENKPPDLIMEKNDSNYLSSITNTLTSIKSINKTDVVTLSTNIGSFKDIVNAKKDRVLACPGFGEMKAKRLLSAFKEPFVNKKN